MNTDDTIAAIATAPGPAGIAVVRLSGPHALAVADRIFQTRGAKPSQRAAGSFTVGHVMRGDERIDRALLLIMRAPNSYTGEDVVELQGHGGGVCARRILRCALDAGARSAGPGEFTQRAFLNGRLDLVQAEAVLDLIHARSDRAAAAALDQLEGGLSPAFDALYTGLIQLAADLEATLDFPEEELPEAVMTELVDRSGRLCDHINRLLDTWDEGHWLRDGALVVISGKPNVGKSTLLNGLLGRERAITSPTPGTTRDTIEEDLVIHGIPIRLIDTAGLRDSDCHIEQNGVERTKASMARADLHLHLLDATQPLDPADTDQLSRLPTDRTILLINKYDLTNTDYRIASGHHSLQISALQDISIERVKEAIRELLAQRISLSARPHAAISERHRGLLVVAGHEMQAAVALLKEGRENQVPQAADHLRGAIDQIGSVTGKVYQDELLNTIFSRFCIGK